MTPTNGAITSPGNQKVGSRTRPKACQGWAVNTPTVAVNPSPIRINQGSSQPNRPTNQGSDTNQGRTKSKTDRDSLARGQPAMEPQAPEHQVAKTDGGNGDQAGTQEDRNALRQVLDVRKFIDRLPQVGLPEPRVGNDFGERLEQEPAAIDQAARWRTERIGVREGYDQEPEQPGEFGA